MCGFTGYIGETNQDKALLESMMNTIVHRGPDSAGMYMDEEAALGFRRLSIIDITDVGNQPISNEDDTKVLVFNGEIYNYKILREELLGKGHVFKTHTDSETILHAFEEWGEKVVDHLRGMYAFVIWDQNEKKLFGARDLFGIKPFYYANINNTFCFGSEIKSFLVHPKFDKKFNEDVLKVDITQLAEEYNGGKPIKVVANLPYYITTPIIMGLFESHVPLQNITVMVQKEVADRMQAGPGSKDYGALSLAVQYYATPYIVANVPPNCFMPRPNVGSAVIRLTLHEEPTVKVNDEAFMFRIIRASFNQRRKTLVNGLTNAAELNLSKEAVQSALERMGLSATVRGEALTLEQFAELTNLLIV